VPYAVPHPVAVPVAHPVAVPVAHHVAVPVAHHYNVPHPYEVPVAHHIPVAVPHHYNVPHPYEVPVAHHVSVPYAHGFDYGHHHDDHEEVILTCAGTTGGDKLSINIKNKKYSPWFTKIGLAKQYGPGLEATVNVAAGDNDAEYSVIMTELFRPDCELSGLGHLVEPQGFLGYGGYGHGGYGGFGYGDSHPGNNYGFDVAHAHPIPGVLTTGEFDSNKASIYIDRLYGFKSLSELAGRGVVLCPKAQVTSDGHGHYECALADPATTGELAPVCCSLEYADEEQFIS